MSKKLLPISSLPDGRTVYIEGNEITSTDALHIAKTLFEAFGGHGPRITRHLMYDVEPTIFAECNHTESFEDAIEMSKDKDEMEKYKRK